MKINKELMEVNNAIDLTITQHKPQVKKYRQGQTKLLGFFVGQVMMYTNGKANPFLVNKLLKEKLDNETAKE